MLKEHEMTLNDTQTAAAHVYAVEGMTCDHCAASVAEEVGELAGAERVAVDLETGRLEVAGAVDDDAVSAAVEEAGYRLAGR
jgi:copper chaperone